MAEDKPAAETAARFSRSLRALLTDEGGIEAQNDPSREKLRFGVSERMLTLWDAKHPFDELTAQQAAAMLQEHLWSRAGCAEYPVGLDYFMFDASWRFGSEQAEKWIKLAVGLDMLAQRKMMLVLVSQLTASDCIRLVDVYIRRRLKSDPRWEVCKHWWTNRSNRVRDRALKMARGEDK